jgi:opacity protein-like surface antigen
MKRTFTGLFMLMAGSLLVVQMASANSIAGKIGLFGNLGYSMYAMDQYNEQVDLQNEFIELMGLTSDGISKLNGGLTFGGGVMYGLMSNLLVGLEIDYLTAVSKGEGEDSGTIMGIPYSTIMKMEASAGALGFGPVIKYAMPIGGTMLLTGGIGLDYASVAGSMTMEVTNEMMGITTTIVSEDEKVSGSGIGFKILVGGEMFVNPMISVGADLGYRILKITEVKDEDGEVIEVMDADGNVENMELDYSGLIIKGGAKLYF